MKKIGILTWHYYNNYGSTLQAYALQKFLKDIGYDNEIINYRNPAFGSNIVFKENIKVILSVINSFLRLNDYRSYPFELFRKKYLKVSRVYYKGEDINARPYSALICGSDQIWAPNVLNAVYMLDFAANMTVKKISYAASLGLTMIPDKLKTTYENYLKRFNNISVREDSGRDILRSLGIESSVVLDPTLLISPLEWQKIENKPGNIDGKYIFCYFLNGEHTYRDKVAEFSKLHNIKVIGISSNPKDHDWINILNNIGPREFLWLVHNAEYVFTDSYHGTIFSIIYNRRFVSLRRFSEKDSISQNSRIDQLKMWFAINDNVFNINNYDPHRPIEQSSEAYEKNIGVLREKSLQYIRQALG
jgi:hypothetical protein